jgi:hypothetical protein
MFFGKNKKKKKLNQMALEVEQRANANPYEPIEVDDELAEFMGAFEEKAISLDDFYELEPGVFDHWDLDEDGSRDGGK